MASYDRADYGEDPVADIVSELQERVESAQRAGIHPARIAVDPGIGFSKKTAHSLTTLVELNRVVELGYPVLVGASRKRVIAELIRYTATTGGSSSGTTLAHAPSNDDRDMATVGVNVVAYFGGARIFRVHNVRPNRLALDAAWALTPEESELIFDDSSMRQLR